MNKKSRTTSAFTLIELLMVIAIIGILAGILIPTVGAVKKQANIAASKSQLSGYINAMVLFKGEYGYMPTFGASGDKKATFTLNSKSNSAKFIETLSGRKVDGSTSQTGGNRRSISFYSFSESEFLEDSDELGDRFGNTDINIVVDTSGKGVIDGLPKNDTTVTVRAEATAYVVGTDEFPSYELY